MPDPGADLRITNDGDLSHAIAQSRRVVAATHCTDAFAMTPRILVTQPVHADVAERLAGLGCWTCMPAPSHCSPEELAQRLVGATAVIGFMTDRIDAAALRERTQLRVVACALKGFDNYDVDACTRAGVWVSIVPDLLTEPTAELAVGLAIGLGRHLRHGDAVVREGRFRGWRPVLYGRGLAGSTVAVIGMGCVGRAIAERGCAASAAGCWGWTGSARCRPMSRARRWTRRWTRPTC